MHERALKTLESWNQPFVPFGDFDKIVPFTIAPKFQKFALQKPFIAQNTQKILAELPPKVPSQNNLREFQIVG